jgi:hypothetical protein
MIPQLEIRLKNYIKRSEKNDKKYQDKEIEFERYFEERFKIDCGIKAVYELNAKKIREQEFSDSQLNIWFDE